MNKRLYIYYTGSVQGVGFRYTAERMATSLHLTGWVKNLTDGRVEVVCEGKDSSLKEFLQKIESVFNIYIRDKEIKWSDATGEFDYFDIRF
jgi:acylphosphatase